MKLLRQLEIMVYLVAVLGLLACSTPSQKKSVDLFRPEPKDVVEQNRAKMITDATQKKLL